MKGTKSRNLWTLTALVLALSLMLPWAVLADDVILEETDVVSPQPHSSYMLNLGQVCAGSTVTGEAVVHIKRAGRSYVFESGTAVIMTVASVSGEGLSATIDASQVNLPSNWETIGMNTLSDAAVSTVQVATSSIGNFSGQVVYRATGASSRGSTLTRDETMHVSAEIIDCTPPTANPSQDPEANGYGWNNSDVTVYWNWADEEGGSGIDGENCTMQTTVSGEGEDIESYATCHDIAGNMGEAYHYVSIDKTPPAVTVTGVEDGAIYIKGAVPEAACSTEDTLSGVQTYAELSVTGGSPIDPGVGSFVATCGDGTDYAGNVAGASATYYVHYDWTGFFRPVDNLPALNSAKAGSAIPVKFSLDGDQGLGIFEAGYPKVWTIPCDAGDPGEPIEETVTAGGSSLTYDPIEDQYIYVWKTDKAWGDSCRQLEVSLIDGTSHLANFHFK